MNTTLRSWLLTITAATGLSAAAQPVLLNDFESYTTPTSSGAVLFRQPSFSGSTGSKLEATPNDTLVLSAGIPSGNANVGNNALWTTFNFLDTGATPLWVRLTTFGAPTQPNPTIALWPSAGIQFDIWSDTPVYLTTLVRETSTDKALGADGGASGSIEYVGGNPTAASGKGKAVAANTWTTLLFNFSTDPVFGLSGNGVLDPGTDNKGVLEALGIATDNGNVQTINVWIDNIQIIPEPSSLAFLLFGSLALAFRRILAQRGKSG